MREKPVPNPLIEGRDYTIEDGMWIFTAYYLRNRGYCCQNGCRNCPYEKPLPPPANADKRD